MELKKNIEKIQELKRKNYELKEKNKNLNEKTRILYHNNYDEFLKNDQIIKNNKKQIEINNIKIAIAKNNIHFLLRNFMEILKNDIIPIYEKQKIGDKTKEKIINNIKTYFLEKCGVNVGGYITIETGWNNSRYEMKITLYFLQKEGYKDFTLEYNEEFNAVFTKEEENTNITYYRNIVEFVEINEIDQKAKKLYKEHKKAIEKINKLKDQQKILYHEFTDYLQGFLYNELEIETKINIY